LKILDELNPPTKILGRFLRFWRDREKTKAEFESSHHSAMFSVDRLQGHAHVALRLSKRLVDVYKFKNILNIEAGMEMIALAMVITSEVRNIENFETL
jgi:hypothetical protein